MNENIFRILAAVILITGMSISIYYRRKADRVSGEKLSRKVDGTPMMTVIRIGGLIFWLSPFVYLVNPAWMNWSKLGLPESVRVFGVGIGILCVLGIYWLFSSIGTGITPTAPHARNTSSSQMEFIATFGIRFTPLGRPCLFHLA